MPGAFLSVSTFFTLSGFLIGRVLLEEHHTSGTVSLRSFWSRRLRRLLPAALAAIAAITVASIWLADATQWLRLRDDALASLAYVANFRFIATGDQYGANFASASPFTHFWTLSIEEQFYVVLPVVLLAVIAVSKGSRRWIGGVVCALIVGSVIWSNWLVSSGAPVDRLYFGTDVRFPEILAGVLLALWWTPRRDPLGPGGERAVAWLGAIALIAAVALWATADLNDTIFYRGGLLGYSALTLAIIVAAMQARGPVAKVLAWRPLVWVGLLSYAAYLVHYPILLWLHQYTGLGFVARLGIGLVASFTIAAISARLLERPIRAGAIRAPGRAPIVAGVSVLACLALIFATTSIADPHSAIDLERAAQWQRYVKATAAQDASDAPRVSLYGDSTAVMTGRGLSEVSRTHPDDFVVSQGWAELGCGLNTGVDRRVRGQVEPPPEMCADWLAKWGQTSKEHPADVALVQLGPWEVTDQELGHGGKFTNIGDPALDELLTSQLTKGIDTLLTHNGMVVLVLPPDVEFGRIDGQSPESPAPESDPDRMTRFREIIESVAATSDRVRVVDLNAWIGTRHDDRSLRPDGIHFTDKGAETVGAWLGPQITDAFTATTGHTTTQVR